MVVARSGRVFKVLIKGKVETMTADCVRLAHIERTPENEQPRQSTTAKRPTAKIHEPQTAVLGKRSTTIKTLAVYIFIVILLIFRYELVLLGRRVVNRNFTISAVEVTTSIVL